jgi:tetratricopeptide (TPR) repeat protein
MTRTTGPTLPRWGRLPSVELTEPRAPQTGGGRDADEEAIDRVGRYRILDRLGSGGMGVVYLAFDPELDRQVAIKVLREDVTARLEADKLSSPLVAEARTMARLNHPNVVRVYDVGQVGERIFVAMEYCEGDTLDAWMHRARPKWREVVRVFIAVGEGLQAAHAAGIVHRDFKPANVFVAGDGSVRVGDFGLARALERDETEPEDGQDTDADRSTVVGTPAYMAPEQHVGRDVDARADQFAFCIALYEAVFGSRPFRGGTVISLAHKKITGQIEPPPPGRGVPRWLTDAILRGLSRDPNARFESMDALLQVLRRPFAARRSWLPWAAGVVPLIALGIVLALTGGDEQRCEAGDRWFDGVWDDARRGAMEQRFAASELGYAPRSFAIAAARLDAWREQWEAAHREACEDAPEDLDRSIACLQRRRSEFAALTDVLVSADAAVVEESTRATAELPSLAACAEGAEEIVGEDDAAVLAKLDEARALEEGGRWDDGLLVATAALRDAEASQSAALRARALHRLGSLQSRQAKYEDAASHLDAAVWLAGAAGLDDVAAAAATLLVAIVGERLARPDDGLQWGRHAASFLDRREDDAVARARLHNNLGQVHEARGDLDAALADYERAQALKDAALPEDHPERATTLLNLGAIEGKRGRLDVARAYLERSLAILERAHGPEHPDVAGPLTNLGNVARAEGDMKAAAGHYRRAIQIREAVAGPASPTLATPLSNLGVVLSAMGEHAEADAMHARVAALFEAAHGREHPKVASAYINRGDAAFRMGDLEAAARHLVTAVEILAAAAPTHPLRLSALSDLGEVQLAAGRWEDARGSFDEALALARSRNAPAMAAARAATGLGRALVELERGVEAIDPLSWSRERLHEAKDPAEPVGKTEFLLARALRIAGREEEAQRHADAARRAMVEAEGDAGPTVAAIDLWRD